MTRDRYPPCPWFVELHGDRHFADDKAIVGGVAFFHGRPVTVIAQAKGRSTKENVERNFGMPSPEGYRKALRLMKEAEKFDRPVLCFVDTPGAFCGLEAEERGQGEAIARNLYEMSSLKVPILSVVIGEGGSGGALAMAVADEVWMLENSIYSILSPEGFASILWKDSSRAKEAARVMKLTASDLKELGIGISLGGLAGAVAAAGGVGIISAAQIGFREADFDKDPRKANLRAIKKELEKARAIAPHGIIGFNNMVAMRHYEDYVKAAAEAGADLIVSGAGLPTELPRLTEGIAISLAPIVSTEKSARVILKYWDKKYGRVPELLVIEGPQAGGHLGFSSDQLKQYGDREKDGNSLCYEKEVKAILLAVKEYGEKYGKKIPVVLGRGIDDREKAEHALSLGVDGITGT